MILALAQNIDNERNLLNKINDKKDNIPNIMNVNLEENNIIRCLKGSNYLITTKNYDSLWAFDYAQNFYVKVILGLNDRVFDKG